GRGADIESQVDGVADLVDVLTARALRADGLDLDLALLQNDVHLVLAESQTRRGGYLLFNDSSAAFCAPADPPVIFPCDTRATTASTRYVPFSNLCNPSSFGGLSFQMEESALSMRRTHDSNPATLKSARPAIAASALASRSCSPKLKIVRAVSSLFPI